MGEGVRTHTRTCAICGRHVRLPNFASRTHFVQGEGFRQTDVHVLSHLTPEERAAWWTLPHERTWPHSKTNTRDDPYGR